MCNIYSVRMSVARQNMQVNHQNDDKNHTIKSTMKKQRRGHDNQPNGL